MQFDGLTNVLDRQVIASGLTGNDTQEMQSVGMRGIDGQGDSRRYAASACCSRPAR